MRNVLIKEMRLSASPLSYIFIAFGVMFFLPGYPILCGAFFVTLGLFHSYQNAREMSDITFSVLLPIAKKDVVKGKYLFTCMIELCAFGVMAAVTLLRMTALAAAPVYLQNALMNANPFALGTALLIFGEFNLIFVGGFFKTAYKLAGPFVTYIVVGFLTVGAAEALHYFPGMGAVNAFGFEHPALQLGLLGLGAAAYAALTALSYTKACRSFERIDL